MNCTTEYSSSSRFSSGVPESTRANRDCRPLMTRLVFASQFLIRWPSSRMIRSHVHLLDGQDVAQHLLVVADGEEAVVVVLRPALGDAAGDQAARRGRRSGGSRSATAT